MPRVSMTTHLYRFFPALQEKEIIVPAGSVAEVLHAVDAMAPGFLDYVLDDRGALRRHVNLCVNDALVIDRQKLSDQVDDDATLYIFQALTGG